MGAKEINVFFLSLGLIVLLLVMAVYLIIISLRRRELYFTKENENAALRHHQELLEARQEMQQSLMQRLGGELHDTIGQKLTLAYLQMENALYLDDIGTLKKHIALQNTLIQESLDELRSLSKILVSHDFLDFSLVHFLEKEMNRLEQSGLCKAVFIAAPGIPKPADERTELTLARICQEFIQNSLKYSGGTEIRIEISASDEKLEIACRDNGKGIDWSKSNYGVRSGSGISMINARALSMGAQCDWRNENGLQLTITLPLQKKPVV
jgi:signal transduction histidine kinase